MDRAPGEAGKARERRCGVKKYLTNEDRRTLPSPEYSSFAGLALTTDEDRRLSHRRRRTELPANSREQGRRAWFAPIGIRIFLYGGYFKEILPDKNGSEKGIVHSDMWTLDPRTWEWNKCRGGGGEWGTQAPHDSTPILNVPLLSGAGFAQRYSHHSQISKCVRKSSNNQRNALAGMLAAGVSLCEAHV
ncbi:hypothetical protein KSP40_PGU019780 [Platanthera guangdongensis]|uniref:Uncharacterized protein n=1 Tax=Platanthera guangdongensis TaxID=2320717 RepID=A0ABR2LL12_9ASPA